MRKGWFPIWQNSEVFFAGFFVEMFCHLYKNMEEVSPFKRMDCKVSLTLKVEHGTFKVA